MVNGEWGPLQKGSTRRGEGGNGEIIFQLIASFMLHLSSRLRCGALLLSGSQLCHVGGIKFSAVIIMRGSSGEVGGGWGVEGTEMLVISLKLY